MGTRPRLRMTRLLYGLAWRADRAKVAAVVAMNVAEAFALVLAGLGLRSVVDGALGGDVGTVALAAGAAALGIGIGSTGSRARVNLRDEICEKTGLLVDREVLVRTAGFPGLDHLERPEYLDRVTQVRGNGYQLADSCWAVLDSVTYTIRLLVSMAVLANVHPLMLLVTVVAAPPLLLNRIGVRRVRASLLPTAETERVSDSLLRLAVEQSSAQELRTSGAGEECAKRADALWADVTREQAKARLFAAVLVVTGWSVFLLGYGGGLATAVVLAANGHSSPGDIVLLMTLVGHMRGQVDSLVSGMTRMIKGLHVLDCYAWLHDHTAAATGAARRPGRVLTEGITLSSLSFRYPGTRRTVLHDVSVHLPAGAMVAVVGEHGSGKTSLVKLLCKLHEPTAGRILVDSVPLAEIDTAAWRGYLAATFQDFQRFETVARRAVGLGDLAHLDDLGRVEEAAERAGAREVAGKLSDGWGTQLGVRFAGGVDLSTGQWQRLALARACMRPAPLLFVLDEPTASLDAPGEYALFSSYVALAREHAARSGAITVIVSHRFSTVRMADLILVLRDGELVESGDHRSLVRAGGLYAELYTMQEGAYR